MGRNGHPPRRCSRVVEPRAVAKEKALLRHADNGLTTPVPSLGAYGLRRTRSCRLGQEVARSCRRFGPKW
jgi:hypothetical protein